MSLSNAYSTVIKSLKSDSITTVVSKTINIERLKTMYFDYTGSREVGIRFTDPRKFNVAQRRFIFTVLENIFSFTRQETKMLKEVLYLRFEALQGYEISLRNDSESTMDDVTILANIILNFVLENDILFRKGYNVLPANQEYYFYECITKRVYCICGKTGTDTDHFDGALGRRKRKNVDHTKYTYAGLYRRHHTEKHNIGITAFKKKHHAKGIRLDQETIKKLYIRG